MATTDEIVTTENPTVDDDKEMDDDKEKDSVLANEETTGPGRSRRCTINTKDDGEDSKVEEIATATDVGIQNRGTTPKINGYRQRKNRQKYSITMVVV